jgi:phosphoribosylformimino-5-aminoimidazole carboxamide ribotide isomerase
MASTASFEFLGLINNFTLSHKQPVFCSFKVLRFACNFFIYLAYLSFEAASLKVIPVIDVLNGVVVHAVRGNRSEYQPLQSVLSSSVDAVEIAAVFKAQGFSELYLADLDAILGKKPNFDLYGQLAQMGFNLMVDAGVTNTQTVTKIQNYGVSKIIVGTETLQNKALIQEVVQQVGAGQIIVSLDLKYGKVLTHPVFDGPTDVFELIGLFQTMGVSEFILLDLVRVGGNEGVDVELLRKVLAVLSGGVYVGGGVRSVDDLLRLKELGVLGVLFATALHLGKIGVKDLKTVHLL